MSSGAIKISDLDAIDTVASGDLILVVDVSDTTNAATGQWKKATASQLASGGAGTVTSVAMTTPSWLSVSGSPITDSGTLAVSAAAGQTANRVLASPDGSSGAVSLRALVADDIPSLTTSKISDFSSWTGSTSIASVGTIATGTWHATAIGTAYGGTGLDASSATNGQLLIGTGSGLALATLTAGANITITNGSGTIEIASSGGASGYATVADEGTGLTQRSTINFTGAGVTAADNSGQSRTDVTINATVTSVDLSVPSWLAVSGNPVTSSGTLAVSAAAGQTANRVLASPDGSSGAVSLRALVAADIPSLSTSKISDLSSWTGSTAITTLGTIATGTWSGTTVAVDHGGTGATSLTAHAVLLGNGTSAIGAATIGTAGRLLIDQGAGADPAFNVMSGDATITNAGAITVSKTGGTAFAASATTDTTNASNISSGTLPTTRYQRPDHWTFGVAGTPAVNGTPPPVYVDRAITCDGITMACGTAPSGGALTVQIEISSDGSTWSNLTDGSVSVSSGAKSGTASCTTAVAANRYLRGKFTAVNGAADAAAVLFFKY